MATAGELTVSLEGAVLELKYGKCGCPPALVGASAGPAFALTLQATSALSKGAPSNMAQVIDSVGAFLALPIPSDWHGRVVVIVPCNDPSPDYTVRLTFEDLTTSTIPLQGLLLMEATRDNPITEVAVKGSVTIAWLVTGQAG